MPSGGRRAGAADPIGTVCLLMGVRRTGMFSSVWDMATGRVDGVYRSESATETARLDGLCDVNEGASE